MPSHSSIARTLPDLPRWVEVRDILFTEEGELFGLQEQGGLSFLLREVQGATVYVVGHPSLIALQAALQDLVKDRMVIAPPEQADWLASALPDWSRTRITVHTLPDLKLLPAASPGDVDFVDGRVLQQLPTEPELLQELKDGAEHSAIAAVWLNGQPVSFCYAASETEAWWDIAIDTLAEHRRKGYAARCVAHMIRYMQGKGKRPVWQAEEENPSSWRLAQKLGFVPVDELALFKFSGPSIRAQTG